MAEFLIELYLARDDLGGLDTRARRVAEDGATVRYLRSIFMPEEETCFLLYEATSLEAVRDAATKAELQFERIIQAVAAP